jgi:hypothetical protein
MAEDKVEKTKIVRVQNNAPVPAAPLTDEEKEARAKAYLEKCACVEMLNSQFDMSNPENPKQVGNKYDHYIDSIQEWQAFLMNHVLLKSTFLRVKYLPKGWPTLEEHKAKQEKLVAEYNKQQALKASEPIL